jgi:site-specific DNA-methyltransferase (cytosine-N4-specific)
MVRKKSKKIVGKRSATEKLSLDAPKSHRLKKKKCNTMLYRTKLGEYHIDKCESKLTELKKNGVKAQLILTSPPFPLNNKKHYGNLSGKDYLNWLSALAPLFSSVLTSNGSIVIELGNAWEKGRPIQSLLTLKSLMAFLENPKAKLKLCQEFVCYNPARLPSPAQWVTIHRIRTIDSFTHIWWMSNSDYPKADNSKILRPYSKSMKILLEKGSYNAGKRPSEHTISKRSFLKPHKGSIVHNVLELEQIDERREIRFPANALSIANTKSNDHFSLECKKKMITPHPARMPAELASLFIAFLTDKGDLVLDPFAGSNTTGYCAEKLKRRWISIDTEEDYGKQSKLRFTEPKLEAKLTYGKRGTKK